MAPGVYWVRKKGSVDPWEIEEIDKQGWVFIPGSDNAWQYTASMIHEYEFVKVEPPSANRALTPGSVSDLSDGGRS